MTRLNTTGALTLPNAEDCANRIKQAQFGEHNYFFSWEYEATKDLKVDWLTGRNICRRHCMDLVSIETRNENEFLKRRMIQVGPTLFEGEPFRDKVQHPQLYFVRYIYNSFMR